MPDASRPSSRPPSGIALQSKLMSDISRPAFPFDVRRPAALHYLPSPDLRTFVPAFRRAANPSPCPPPRDPSRRFPPAPQCARRCPERSCAPCPSPSAASATAPDSSPGAPPRTCRRFAVSRRSYAKPRSERRRRRAGLLRYCSRAGPPTAPAAHHPNSPNRRALHRAGPHARNPAGAAHAAPGHRPPVTRLRTSHRTGTPKIGAAPIADAHPHLEKPP